MKLKFDITLVDKYSSNSQKIRILSEDWVKSQIFCPNCGHNTISDYSNNKPVADFYCVNCKEDYELKSKSVKFGIKVVDGAYYTMIDRLKSNTNPNLFLLSYDLHSYNVNNFIIIPKHFFIPEIIEKRKPLSLTARRAGWTGCNIKIQNIPDSGKIYLIKNSQLQSKQTTMNAWQKTLFVRNEKNIFAKSWLLDVMRCVDKIDKNEFRLSEVYVYEKELYHLHPNNKHIKEKIRQQLQILRNNNYLDFLGRGIYKLK